MTYAMPYGTSLPGGGGGAAQYDMAVFRGKVTAVGKEEDPRVLKHPLLRPFVATARLLKKERAAPLMTGIYRNHERNRAYHYRADGTIDELERSQVDGVRTRKAIWFDVETLEDLRADDELETGVADATADFCEYVVDDSAAECQRKILTFVQAELDVLDQEGLRLAGAEAPMPR